MSRDARMAGNRGALSPAIALGGRRHSLGIGRSLGSLFRRRPRGSIGEVYGKPRLLVPFVEGALDEATVSAALRIARAEGAVIVPAQLVLVPREFSLDAALAQQAEAAVPVLEAVELLAGRAGIPVDARIERGRTPTHALERLWSVERFDRILAPAPLPGQPGFTPKELAWLLTHAPVEMQILRPTP